MNAPASGPPTDRMLRAILSTIVAMVCFAFLNAMSKTLSTSGYPVIEVIWRAMSSPSCSCWRCSCRAAAASSSRSAGSTPRCVRGLLLFFLSLPFLPRRRVPAAGDRGGDLAIQPDHRDGAVIALLDEPVGPRRWAAVAVGFVGALIVVRPGHADFDWQSLLIVRAPICSSFYQLFSRRYGQTERPTLRPRSRPSSAPSRRRRSCRSNGDAADDLAHGPVRRHGHHGRDRPLFSDDRLQPGAGRGGVAVQLHPADRLGDSGLCFSTTSPTSGPGSAPP